MCSQFKVLELYTAKLLWPVEVQVQGTRRAPESAHKFTNAISIENNVRMFVYRYFYVSRWAVQA